MKLLGPYTVDRRTTKTVTLYHRPLTSYHPCSVEKSTGRDGIRCKDRDKDRKDTISRMENTKVEGNLLAPGTCGQTVEKGNGKVRPVQSLKFDDD